MSNHEQLIIWQIQLDDDLDANRTSRSVPENNLSSTSNAIGGIDSYGDSLSSVEAYDPSINKWTLIKSLRCPRWGCFGCSFEDKLYVMGGRSSFTIGNSRFADVYHPESHSWNEMKSGCVMVTAHAVLDKKLFCIEWKNQRKIFTIIF